MTVLLPRTVRGRLWAALGLLSLAILCISVLTWMALQRVDDRLQELHRQSLSQVAEAIVGRELPGKDTRIAIAGFEPVTHENHVCRLFLDL